ncbi:hypothetical protein GGI26_004944 [Coemansia sp. RSA 1358]|uniref:AB hydrolase-1 domain-containing protein n=1 Tax=Coemansia umbellata TaxID=1424467 RepID=A0ABQ8PIE8_9FUNG|nr:hypothetical protein EDC05_004528 [Coemansia umbellata]KAJ2620537.1 hypothetical protein GGI26_004944 [Coemansia sp. RSA 1358]
MNVVKKIFDTSRSDQKIAANIYYSSSPAISSDKKKRLTLLLAHANGFHKELWEPALTRLFSYDAKDWLIDQAIALDSYNHGDSAVLNRPSIEAEETSPWFMNARDILAVIAQLGQPENIVGVGHSWGAVSLLLSEIMSPLTFAALIITDPVLYSKPIWNKKLLEITMKRRCEWPDVGVAKAYFDPHPFFGTWDKRIRELHIKYGLEPVSKSPAGQKLMLKCRPVNEAAVYAGSYHASPHATDNLWKVQCPTAFLTGEKSDLSPEDYIKGITSPMPDCQHVVMKSASHLLVFEDPDQTADCYADFLDSFAPKLMIKNPAVPPANL